jgi:SAM-dependent methyltransferase
MQVLAPWFTRTFVENYMIYRNTSPALALKLKTLLEPKTTEIGVDLGCGTGNYSIPFIEDFKKIIGVDISKEMLIVARKRSDRIDWIHSDILNLPFQPSMCNKAWGILSFHHCRQKQRELFQSLHKILAPNGKMVFFTQFAEQINSLWLRDYLPSLDNNWIDKYPSTSTLKEWLEEAGFSEIEFIPFNVSDTQDAFLRVGQNAPELYLSKHIFLVNPVGWSLSKEELDEGISRLSTDIKTGQIRCIIKEYRERASMIGEYGFVTAQKNL